MKTLRGFALVMVLAGSVYAGDIQNPVPAPPPSSRQTNAAKMPNRDCYCDISQSFTSDRPTEVTMRATIVQVMLEALLSLY